MSAVQIPAWEAMDLATRIRVLCAVKNVTLPELAKAAGLGSYTLNKLAIKGDSCSLNTLQRIAASLDVSLSELVPPLEVEA